MIGLVKYITTHRKLRSTLFVLDRCTWLKLIIHYHVSPVYGLLSSSYWLNVWNGRWPSPVNSWTEPSLFVSCDYSFVVLVLHFVNKPLFFFAVTSNPVRSPHTLIRILVFVFFFFNFFFGGQQGGNGPYHGTGPAGKAGPGQAEGFGLRDVHLPTPKWSLHSILLQHSQL